jgi:hypothetical protein
MFVLFALNFVVIMSYSLKNSYHIKIQYLYLACRSWIPIGLPPGVILHYFDNAYHVKLVVDHFKWDQVILIGHR